MDSSEKSCAALNLYESEKLLGEYLLFHYGQAHEVMPYEFGPSEALDFPKRLVEEFQKGSADCILDRALDLGCAVGRSSFELSKTFNNVLGIDYSNNFIKAAETIRSEGELDFRYQEEGKNFQSSIATIPKDSRADNIEFAVGDACNLDSKLSDFNFVLAANILCRLPDPSLLLKRLPSLVAKNGYCLIASPYSWLLEYTPQEKWLGGFEGSAEKTRSLEQLKKVLSSDFELVQVSEMPFLIREHQRKFQWSVSQGSLWKRL